MAVSRRKPQQLSLDLGDTQVARTPSLDTSDNDPAPTFSASEKRHHAALRRWEKAPEENSPTPLTLDKRVGVVGQLPMFMSARQILEGPGGKKGARWQALDGDRNEVEGERAGSYTNRQRDTAGRLNERAVMYRPGGYDVYGNRHYVEATPPKPYQRAFSSEETDEELFARKLDEASMSPGERRDYEGREPETAQQSRYYDSKGEEHWAEGRFTDNSRGDETWVHHDYVSSYDLPSLRDVIHESKGNIPGALSLGVTPSSYGSMGLPQLLGGHHRTAVMKNDMPDHPIPVEFYRNFWHARQSGRYT